jgi:hypothetical protein
MEEKDILSQTGEKEGRTAPEPGDREQGSKAKWSDNALLYEFGFSTFILSLSTSALVHLGELPDPLTNKKEVNLQLARQTISIIEMLQDKTKGNLTAEEGNLIESVLYDVRLKYVQSSS